MPNWVTNRIIIEGPDANKIMAELTRVDNNEERYFDFNKIIAMPEELNIISGSLTNKAIEIYLTHINPQIDYFGPQDIDEEFFLKQRDLANSAKSFGSYSDSLTFEELKKVVDDVLKAKDDFKIIDDVLDYGKKAISNIERFGSLDWYDWSIKNWGTKWNSCHNLYSEELPNEIMFDTAWSNVIDLIALLSTKYPENEFTYTFAEEWAGHQAGNLKLKNGEVVSGDYFDDESKEAYETAFSLWGEELKDNYIYDKKKNTYIYKEEYESEDQEEM